MAAFFLIILFCVMSKSLLAQEYRLSKDILPETYEIHIKPYLQLEDGEKQFTFEGQLNLTLHSVIDNAKKITLHKDLIDILNTLLYDANGNLIQKINNESLNFDSQTTKLIINLEKPLMAGEHYTLYFEYIGKIRNGMEGFYRATDDNINWYGLTQLHRIDARTVFPCFDEPEFKAKFRIHISRPKEYNSFFNTRLINSTNDGDHRFIDHFEETPLMSTYLMAFVISDFQSQGNKDLKIITHPKFNNKTNFAFEVGLKVLSALDNYTDMPYKTLGNTIIQMVATNHFPHSGMENWGLVFYKEAALAHESGYTDDWSHKQYTVSLVVHETAHMWFGNSVTHKWWSYFWLNEAFPNYYQYFLAHEIYPEYEFDKQFIIKELHSIFDVDATNTTQPLSSLEKSINTPSEIGSKFNNIGYSKGASVLRMFQNLMGKENFDTAIRIYLKENQSNTTIPGDLFKQLKKYWPPGHMVDLDEFFKDWTEQVGYPMVIVSKSGCGDRFAVKQQRFLLDPTDGSDAVLKYTIPITVTYDKLNDFRNSTPAFYLNKSEEIRLFGNATLYKWVMVNNQQYNYYRVFYDTELLKELSIAFRYKNHSGIHVNNRASVVDDLFTYGHIGLRGYDEVFEFLEYLATEMEYLPWQAAFKGLNVIYQRLTLAQHNKFSEFLYDILKKIFLKLGFGGPNDSVLQTYQRNAVISLLCKYHHEECNVQAQTKFKTHLSTNTKPSPDFRETLYCAAVRNDNSNDTYIELKKMFLDQQLISEKEKILRAMGCTRFFVRDHYDFILTNNIAPDLKTLGLKGLYSQTPENINTVFNLIIENSEQLAEVLKDWATVASVIKDIAQYLTTHEQLTLLKTFTTEKGNVFNESLDVLEQAIENVEDYLEWSTDYLGKLMNYLTARNVQYRLNTDIVPNHYEIHIKPYLKPNNGDKREVNITIHTNQSNQKKITLHQKNIEILEAILYDANGNIVENITSGSMLQEPLTDKLTVCLQMPLEVNTSYILHSKYQDQIRNDMEVIFRATNDDAQ